MAKNQEVKAVKVVRAKLDKSKAHEIVCGIPSIHYRQNGKHFDAGGNEANLPVEDKRTDVEKKLLEVLAENAELKQAIADLTIEIAKQNLKVEAAPVVEETKPESETIVVNVKEDGKVEVSKPVDETPAA